MATPQQKAQCVIWLVETNSVTTVQRYFRREYGGNVPDPKSIRKWLQQFKETGSVLKGKSPGRPTVSAENVERIRASCSCSPKKSLVRRSLQLGLPRSIVYDVVRKRLKLHAYKIQLVHEIKSNDKGLKLDFAVDILNRIDDSEDFLNNVMFTDESTFHVNGVVNRHNCRIWGSQKPQEIVQYQRDSPKVNVWCGLMNDRIVGPFIFAEKTITGDIYCDMLELYVFPQVDDIEAEKGLVIFQQDGAPPHYKQCVRSALDARFPGRWMGRGGPIAWPPRSPDITPLDFFLWGYVKNFVYSEKIRNIDHLRQRIIAAVASVTPNLLTNTWREFEYRLDICRATNGSHIEVY
uniref:DUF4817 domain-containing protein n=1 Tax=Cuerna arida TaxID=1464854 RepID=A0A1B6EKB9_9HEMI